MATVTLLQQTNMAGLPNSPTAIGGEVHPGQQGEIECK